MTEELAASSNLMSLLFREPVYKLCLALGSTTLCQTCKAISKKVSYFLRHVAPNPAACVLITPDGFVLASTLLTFLNKPKAWLSEAGLRTMVEVCPKQRFLLAHQHCTCGLWCACTGRGGKMNPPALWVRANQGHTDFGEGKRLLSPDLLFQPVLSSKDAPVAVHGTSLQNYKLILESGGLKAMSRTHVHFAQGLPGTGFISGMREKSAVLLYLDVDEGLRRGMKIYKSTNGVILASGIGPGVVISLDLLRVVIL